MYDLLIKQLPHVLEGETNVITNFANFSSLLFNSMKDVNWVGFYVFTGNELLLGPFQGRPACVRIKTGRGVCGTVFSEDKTMILDDVDDFPDHIVCDPATKSEIAMPLKKDGKLYGVFDIDSPILSRFDENDRNNLEILLNLLVEHSNIEELSRIYLNT
jgi:GAF domain-containing protein